MLWSVLIVMGIENYLIHSFGLLLLSWICILWYIIWEPILIKYFLDIYRWVIVFYSKIFRLGNFSYCWRWRRNMFIIIWKQSRFILLQYTTKLFLGKWEEHIKLLLLSFYPSRPISLIYNGNHDALSRGNLDIIICKLKQKISRLL